MKKKIIILSVLLLSTFLIVCICFINREANLINTFEKTNTTQTLFEVVSFYQKKENYSEIVKYSELLLFDDSYNFNEIDLRKTDYEDDVAGMYDYCMQQYFLACSHVYEGDEYIEKIISGYTKYNNYGYAISGVVDSIQEYYTINLDSDVCINAYDRLFEVASHVVTKKMLISNKYDFVSTNCENEQLIKQTEADLKEYNSKVSNHMKESKQKGVGIEEYNSTIKP